MPADESRERVFERRDRLVACAIALFLLGVYLFTMGGHTTSVDGEIYLAGTRALAHGTTILDPGPDMDGAIFTQPNKNGEGTTAAPIGSLLLFLPGYLAGKAASVPFAAESKEAVLRLVYLSANSLMTALTGGLVFLLCRSLRASRRAAALLAITYGLCTWAWGHSQTDFTEPGTALLLTAAVLAATVWWRKPTLRNAALVGLLCSSVVLTRSSTVLLVPVFLVVGLAFPQPDTAPRRFRQTAAFFLGCVGPGVLFAVNSYIRFGSPFDNGYPNLAYATPVYEGVFGLFLSPGKGLLWYAPICIVSVFALRRSFIANRRYVVFVGALLAAHLVVYARFKVWSGENAFGPRYLIPLLPLLVALVAPVIDSGREWLRGVKAAALVGFLVPGLLGATLYFNAVYFDNALAVAQNMHLTRDEMSTTRQHLAWNFQPRSSPLILHLRSVPDLVSNTIDRLQGEDGGIMPMPETYEKRFSWYEVGVELDMWWAWWPSAGASSGAYLFLVVPVAAFLGSWRIFRKLRPRAKSGDHQPEVTSELV